MSRAKRLTAEAVTPHSFQSLDLRVRLYLRPGTTIQMNGKPVNLPLETSEPLTFVGANGETMLLQPPSVYEQANPKQRVTGRYVLAASNDSSVMDLRVRFPWRWLAASERSFPVILDPLFQTKTPTTSRSAYYAPGGAFLKNYAVTPLPLGGFADGPARILARFQMPALPSGANITKAYLVAMPSGSNEDYASDLVTAYALANADWTTSDTAAPQSIGGALPTVGFNTMQYTHGREYQLYVAWNVTSLAVNWLANPASNDGDLSIRPKMSGW